MSYESYCAACTYLGEEADYNGKYLCERNWERISADTPKCYNFCEAYSRSDSARSNMIKNSQGYNSSGCYITTMLCNILELGDNNYYLNVLRKFRGNVMQKNIKYFGLLLTYDTIGPIIASELQYDENRHEIASFYFNHYIIPAVSAIECEKNEEAIELYKTMTYKLRDYYHADRYTGTIGFANIDINNMGHGYLSKKKSFN